MEDKIINKVITRFETQGYQEAMKKIESVSDAQDKLSIATKPLGWAKTRGHVYKNMRSMRYLEKFRPNISAFNKSDLAKSSSFKKSLEDYVTNNVNASIKDRLSAFNPELSAFKSEDLFGSSAFQESIRDYVTSNVQTSLHNRLNNFNPELSAFRSNDLFSSDAFKASIDEYVRSNVSNSLNNRLNTFNPELSAFKSNDLFLSDSFKTSLNNYVTQNVNNSLHDRLSNFNPELSAFKSDDLFKSDAFKASLNNYVTQNVNNSLKDRLSTFNPELSAFKSDDLFKSDRFKASLNSYVTQNVNKSLKDRLNTFNPEFSAFKSTDVFKSPAFQRSMEEYVIDNIGQSLEDRFSDFNPRMSAFKSDKLAKSPAFKKSLEKYVIDNIDYSINQRLNKFDPKKSAFNSASFVKSSEFKKGIEDTVLNNIAKSRDARMAFDPKRSAFSGKFRTDLSEKELDDQLKKYESILNRVTSFQKKKLSDDILQEESQKAIRERILRNITSQKEIRAGAAHSRAITAMKRADITQSYSRRVNLKKFQESYGNIVGLKSSAVSMKSSMATYRHLNKLNAVNKKYNRELKKEQGLKSRLSKSTSLKSQKNGRGFGGNMNAFASRAMLWMGFASLTSYLIRGFADRTMQLGDAMASSEIDILKGQGYREHYRKKYGNTIGFDEAARYHSRISGEGEYMGRSRIATIAGGLEASNINMTPDKLKDIVTAAQGVSILKNTDFENAYEGVIGILTKRRTPEEEKLVGVQGGGSPEQLLQKILDHLKNNPTTAGILGKSTLKATMQSMRSAPQSMLADVYARNPKQATRGFVTLKDRWNSFFDTSNRDKLEAWASAMESWNQIIESFDLGKNRTLIVLLKTMGATVSYMLQGLGTFLSSFGDVLFPNLKDAPTLSQQLGDPSKNVPKFNASKYILIPKTQNSPTISSIPGYSNYGKGANGANQYNVFKVDNMTISENEVVSAAIMTQVS